MAGMRGLCSDGDFDGLGRTGDFQSDITWMAAGSGVAKPAHGCLWGVGVVG